MSALPYRFGSGVVVWLVSESPEETRPVNAADMTSYRYVFSLSVVLYQLPLLKSPDLLVLAFGNGGQRENPPLRPFGHGAGDLFEIGDAPLGTIAHQ